MLYLMLFVVAVSICVFGFDVVYRPCWQNNLIFVGIIAVCGWLVSTVVSKEEEK